jgi:hypothetical protein
VLLHLFYPLWEGERNGQTACRFTFACRVVDRVGGWCNSPCSGQGSHVIGERPTTPDADTGPTFTYTDAGAFDVLGFVT